MINQKSKVFLFTFLILSLALVPPTNFAFAADVLVVDNTNSPYTVSSDEQWNTVSLEVGTSLIVPADVTLTVNQIDNSSPVNGLHIKNNAVVTIEKGGTVTVTGWTFNLGEIYIDGSYSHTSGTIFTPSGDIYERCGIITDESYSNILLQGDITNDFVNCNDVDELTIQDLFVPEGIEFVIERHQVLNLFGDTTLSGFLINKGILNNPTIVTLAGGEIRNMEGTINNICGGQGYPFPNYVGSGGDQIAGGIVQDVPCLEPEAVDDNYQVNEDDTLTVTSPGVLENDVDNNGVGINATNPSDPSNGTLSNFAYDGSFTYTPNPNFFGIDSFTYQVKDRYDVTNDATVTIDVLPVSDGPIALDDNYQINEDETLTVPAPLGVLRNDTDVDMTNDFTAQTLTNPSDGTLTLLTDGSFTYTPTVDFSGTDSFTYDARDGNGSTATATVTIDVLSVSDGPIAVDDDYQVNEDETLTVSAPGVLGNDVDSENVGINAINPSDPTDGTLSNFALDGSFTYTPNPNFFGTDSFTYEIIDGNDNLGLAPATVNIEVIEADPPIAVDDLNYFVDEDGTLQVDSSIGLLNNDIDVNAVGLEVSSTSYLGSGTLLVNDNGSFTYTPANNFLGTDSFTYEIIDGNDNLGLAPATVNIEVMEVTVSPIAVDDLDYSTSEGEELIIDSSIGLLNNDIDVNAVGLEVSSTSYLGSGTLLVNDNGSFTYTPANNFLGTDSFTYEIIDGNDNLGLAPATVNIEVIEMIPGSLYEQQIYQINELDELIDQATKKKTVDELNKALKKLTKSVELKKWKDDGNHLVENEGKKVFNQQANGVKHIMKVLKDEKESEDFLIKLSTIMLDLVEIDEELAEIEYLDAKNSDDPKEKQLDKADEEFLKVEKELEKNHYDHAIKHLGHAWNHSVKAQK